MSHLPLHRFEEFGRLSDTERAAVMALAQDPFAVSRGRHIAREGERVTGFFLLLTGWIAASHVLPDGGRQIMKIHLPGDALGTPAMAMRYTTESLTAITDALIARVPLASFGKIFDNHPRIAARFMLSIQQERIALMDRLAAIGRTSAEARVAGFLLDLRERLEPLHLVTDEGFDAPITQEQIGDALGLTSAHVNRVLATLTAKRLLERKGKRYRLPDINRLTRLASRPDRQPLADQSWLPADR